MPEGGIREGMAAGWEDVLSNGAPPVPAATALTAGGGPGLVGPGGVGRGPGSFLPSLVVGRVGAASLASVLAAFQAGVLSFFFNSLFFHPKRGGDVVAWRAGVGLRRCRWGPGGAGLGVALRLSPEGTWGGKVRSGSPLLSSFPLRQAG